MSVFKKFKPVGVSRVYRFPDPTTGRMFTGKSIQELVDQVVGYRKQNELEELEYLHSVVENFLCGLPENVGQCMPLKQPKKSIMQFIEGGVATLKNIAYKSFVDQSEADRRSEICARCPENSFPNRDHFVKWVENLAVMSVGDRKSARHEDLGICNICQCPMRGKVFYKGKIRLTPEQLDAMKKLDNPRCWQVDLAEAK